MASDFPGVNGRALDILIGLEKKAAGLPVEWRAAFEEDLRRLRDCLTESLVGEAAPGQDAEVMASRQHQAELEERKRIEEELRAREASLRQIQERLEIAKSAARLGIHDYNILTGELTWDERVREIWGAGPDEPITYETFLAGLHPADHPAVHAVVSQALDPEGTGKYYAEYRVIHRGDRSERWVASNGQVFFEEGRAVRLVGTVEDITGRKQVEEAITTSERKYRELAEDLAVERSKLAAAIDNLPVGVGIEDARGDTISLNRAGLALHGFQSEADMLSRLDHYFEEFELHYLDGQVMPVEEWPASRALRGEYVQNYELILRNKREGYDRVLSYRVAPVRSGSGEIVQLLYVMQDMTEQKRVEQALRESEGRLRDFTENTHDSLFILDREWRFQYANHRFCEIMGAQPDELLGNNIWEVYPSYRGTEVEQHFRKAMEEQTPVHFELSGVYSGAWYAVSVYPTPEGVSVYSIDRTEQHLWEAAMRESERRERERANELETLMDATPVIIWISRDPECNKMIGNRSGYEFLRMGPGVNVSKTAPVQDLEAQSYQNMKDGRPIPPGELPMQIAAARGIPARDYEFEIVFEDGRSYTLLGNVNPLFDVEGKPGGAVGAFIDITRLRQLEALQIETKTRLEVQRRLMEIREEERQGIARDIHDGPIQTLSSIVFHLQFLKETFTDSTLAVELSQIDLNIKNTVRELRDVINELRPPSIIRFGLSKAIGLHSGDLRERHPGIHIHLETEEDGSRLSEQARLALYRIYQEATMNVVRHSGAANLVVSFRIEADGFTFEIHDDGQGFEVEPNFSRLSGEGHFGLVGMEERARSIGGTFSLVSEPGKGTTIIVKGPITGN